MSKYALEIHWDESDQIYVANAPELPGCMAHGDSPEEALANIQTAMEFWLETAKELGREIPLPGQMRVAV